MDQRWAGGTVSCFKKRVTTQFIKGRREVMFKFVKNTNVIERIGADRGLATDERGLTQSAMTDAVLQGP